MSAEGLSLNHAPPAQGNLSSLSPGEREVLAMLAQGHTAKSVASATGLSVAAVNERLRAARRKTGIGSSRELARELHLQENRDKEIEVSPAGDLPSALPLPPDTGRRTMMTITATATLSIAAVMLLQTPGGSAPSPAAEPAAKPALDPMLGLLVEQQPSLPTMHALVRSEPRDNAWASQTESVLRARYAKIPNLLARGESLRVTCASTLCEIAGPIPKGLSQTQLNKVVDDLQGRALHDDLATQGLKNMGMGFSGVFVAYWARAQAAE